MKTAAAPMRRQEEEDRLSKLGAGVLGNVLSFLPAKEAARAAMLSTRWRDLFAGVHTVALEEPAPDYFDNSYDCDCHYCMQTKAMRFLDPPLFLTAVTAALVARHRRQDQPAPPPPPLRALRVTLDGRYHRLNYPSTVDSWISYALKQAAAPAGLELVLRLRRDDICSRRPHSYSVDADSVDLYDQSVDKWGRPRRRRNPPLNDDDDIVSSDDERVPTPQTWSDEYNAPPMLFSSAVLRSLRIGPCRLSLPAAITLPALEELVLIRVSNDGEDVQRLVSACPRLADLTLEACHTVTALSLVDCRRLRRLALRCCHNLATVAVDTSGELHTLDYHGAVPDKEFFTMHGSGGSITSCNIDICGEEFSSEEELAKLRDLLQLLAPSTKHLHLRSSRLGASIEDDAMAPFPPFPHLRDLELRGRLQHDDTAVVSAVSRILRHAPSLEELTLVFETGGTAVLHEYERPEFLDVHHLSYDEHDALLGAAAPPADMIPCLKNRVREINLVHYHGGRAQRTLAKFLLRNAPLLEQLYCGFAMGPLWTQTKLRDEINGWAMNKPSNRIFS